MKKILSLFLVSFLSITPTIFATTQIIFSGSADDLNATTTEYNPLHGAAAAWNGTSSRNLQRVASSGSFKNLRVVLTAAPGTGKSHTFTVMEITGGATALACTVSEAATTCQDSDTITVTAGEEYNLRSTHSGTPDVSDAWWSVEFDSTTANESMFMGNSAAGFFTTGYNTLHGAHTVDGTRTDTETVLTTAGTIKNLNCSLDSDPGVGNTDTCTVMENGSDTALTCTIIGGATSNCTDVVNSFTSVAGDKIVLKVVHSAGSASDEIESSVTFLSDTAGDFNVSFSSDDDPANAATEYNYFSTGTAGWTATETTKLNLGQEGSATDVTLKALYVDLETAPGAGNSYALTVYQDSSPTALSCTVSGTDTTCSDTATIAVANDDLFSIEEVPTSTPTASNIRYGVLVSSATIGGAARRIIIVQ